jgi:hydroxyethylthiazole kinase-like uncharacterized protein yjeF
VKNIVQITKAEVLNRYRPIDKFTHKGIQGHVLIIGGSYGKIGSICLAGKAALRTGCGLVTALVPQCGYEIVQSSVPEMMVLTSGTNYLEDLTYKLVPQAVAIGPGMGQELLTADALRSYITQNQQNLVIDADALNIISSNPDLLSMLPPQTVLTPHLGELARLIGDWKDEKDKLQKVQDFSKKYNLIVVVKGVPTFIVHDHVLYENPSGNAALATAGSGDVLTGIITSLIAQGYPPLDAAITGVYLHGHTADLALPETGYHSFIASDIIANLGRAWLSLTSL